MIIAIVAWDSDFGIGKNGDIPWRCKEDFKHFKETTKGHQIMMGRKTWESLPKKPLTDRTNIVITRQEDYQAEGAVVVNDVVWPNDGETLFVIGGSEIYKMYEPYLDKIVSTYIPGRHECDTKWNPLVNDFNWECEETKPLVDDVTVSTYCRRE